MVDAADEHPSAVVQIGFQRRQSKAFRQAKQFVDSGAGRRDRAGRRPDPLPRRHQGPHAAGPAAVAGLGPVVRPRAQDPLQPPGGPPELAAGEDHAATATWSIGASTSSTPAASILGLVHAAGGSSRPAGSTSCAGKITTPDTLTVHFEFDRCPVVWRHRIWGAEEYCPEVNNGIFLYGEKATVFATDDRWVVIPQRQEQGPAGARGQDRHGHRAHGRLPRAPSARASSPRAASTTPSSRRPPCSWP